MTFLVYYDIFQLVSQLVILSILLADELSDAKTLNILKGRHFVYWFFSSGLFTILLGIKSFYGFKFVWAST